MAWENVSRETFALLGDLARVFSEWQDRHNLISAGEISRLWRRHMLDSLQLAEIGAGRERWVDFGSGSGFPALVIACHMKASGFGHIDLVESSQKKGAYLRHAVHRLGLPATIHVSRIEALTPWPCDVICARALASLDQLLRFSAPWMGVNTVAIFPKGAGYSAEREIASQNWRFSDTLTPSVSDSQGVIVQVTEVYRAEP